MTDTLNPGPGQTHTATIKYTLTRRDLFRAVVHQVVRNRVLIVFVLLGSTSVAGLFLRQPEMEAQSIYIKALFVVSFDLLFIAIVTFLGLGVLWLTILGRKYRGVLCEHTLEVSEAGLMERTDVNETLHRWPAFHKVVRSSRYLHLYVTDALVHTVPLRFFASEDQIQSFLREIERYRTRA